MVSNTKPTEQVNIKGNSKSFLSGLASGLFCGMLYQPLEVLKINMIILPEDLFRNNVMRTPKRHRYAPRIHYICVTLPCSISPYTEQYTLHYK